MLKVVNIVLAITAVAIIAFYIFYEPVDHGQSMREAGHIEKCIPEKVDGWTWVDQPLAQTEEVLRSTEKILRASQTFFRKYTSLDGMRSFQVYVAYWGRGVETPRMAASHTPDRCWVQGGWVNDMEKLKYPYEIPFKGVKLMPANYRELSFDSGGQKIKRNVVFWHVADGKPFVFGQRSTFIINPLLYIKFIYENAVVGAPEQYFVRIDSSIPLEELWPDKGVGQILEGLGKLILEQK